MWGKKEVQKTSSVTAAGWRTYARLLSSSYHLSDWGVLIWSSVTSHQCALMLSLTTAWGQYTTLQISRVKKIQLIRSLVGKSFNLISQRRMLHVPHWSMSEFGGLRDCGTGLLRLDRDSYWVHSSLGSDKGLRASDESDNGSCPWLSPMVFGFGKKTERK